MIVNNDLNYTPITNFNLDSMTTKEYKNFSEIFDSALDILGEANSLASYAEKLQVDYVTGVNDDVISLNMAQSRASFAVQFAAQVTDKVVTAYKEIMSISI